MSFAACADYQGLLLRTETAAAPEESVDEDELLAELRDAAGASDITDLRHVRTAADKRAAEEIANRKKCEEFERFKPLFIQVKKDLDSSIAGNQRYSWIKNHRSWFVSRTRPCSLRLKTTS
jgi:uncharacterized Zn finger protein